MLLISISKVLVLALCWTHSPPLWMLLECSQDQAPACAGVFYTAEVHVHYVCDEACTGYGTSFLAKNLLQEKPILLKRQGALVF